MTDMSVLTGRRALVTGAGRGIGRAIALRLAQDGADVVVNDLDPDGAADTAERIRASGRRAEVAIGDLRDTSAVHGVCDAAIDQLGGIDILVNNAGISLYRAIVDCSEDDWDAHLGIMAKATFLTMRRLAPPMMERGWGRVVNLGSYVAQFNCTTKYFGPYVAAKFAIVGLTQVAAQEFACGRGQGGVSPAVDPRTPRTARGHRRRRRLPVHAGSRPDHRQPHDRERWPALSQLGRVQVRRATSGRGTTLGSARSWRRRPRGLVAGRSLPAPRSGRSPTSP